MSRNLNLLMSLYLKYRPQDFQSIVGQVHAKKTIQAAIEQGTLSHAYLFCGPRGTGKTSMARILAKRINCKRPKENEPCNACEICQAIQKGQLVDLIEIDAASNRGIDEIRELREKIGFSPTQAKAKVYIIDEVHMLTKEAFNALLKTLEEPPEHAYFILATTEAHKIPETIVSRCQQFSFKRINEADISTRLNEIATNEEVKVETKALNTIAKLSQGGLRDAIGLLEQMMANGAVTSAKVSENLGLIGESYLETFYQTLCQKNPEEGLNQIAKLKQEGKSLDQFLKAFTQHLQSKVHEAVKQNQETHEILNWIEHFLAAKKQMDLSPIPELPIEIAVLRINQSKNRDQKMKEGEAKKVTQEPQKKVIKTPEEDTTIRKKEQEIRSEKKGEKQAIDLKTEALNNEKIKLEFTQIQKDWKRVLEHVKTPFVRMSLSNGELSSYEKETLSIQFKSSAFRDRVDDAKGKQEVSQAIKTVFGTTINLSLELKELHVTPKTESEAKERGINTAKMAADVFGIEK